MSSPKYPHLFSPLKIGNATVANRILQTAHVKLFTENGIDSQRNIDYQVARARGGAGLLITGNRLVHPTSTTGMPRFAFAFLKGAVELNQRLTAAVHEHGALIFEQLNHFGGNASSDSADDLRVLWGPSNVKSPAYGEMPKAMEQRDIDEVIEWWAHCAELSREGGFDGTEVHIGHSYLLHQFLSPLYNKREDGYGGSLANRLRFALEVIAAVRERVGTDWVVGVRVTLSDFFPGGLDIDDARETLRLLEEPGQLDYVNVTAAGYHNIHEAIQPSDAPDGYLVDLAAELKSSTTLPVFTIGGIKDAAFADALIAEGKADMVAMTRAQIADPEFANKAREGRDDEIIHCIRGNQGCIGRVFKGLPINCTVNPVAGRERRFGQLPPAEHPGRWIVVGGGPAGMKAAETLARRGHDTTLLEQSERLGGQVNLIVQTPGRDEFGWITRDLETQLGKLGVDVRLGTAATADSLRALDADGIVLATGALASRAGFSSVNPLVDELPGASQDNVLTSWEAIEGSRPIGARVVLLDDDGTRAAAGVAMALLDRGHEVTVATRWSALFPFTLYGLDMAHVYADVFGHGLAWRANVWASAIDGTTVRLFNLYTGAEEPPIEADTVVLTGVKPNDELYLALSETGLNLHRVGDCVAPRKLDHAIYEGYLAGRELFDPHERYIYEGELEREVALETTG